MGYTSIYKAISEKLQANFGETTSDKRFTILPNCCLGCCDRAPALMVDEDLYRDVTIEQLDSILEKYK